MDAQVLTVGQSSTSSRRDVLIQPRRIRADGGSYQATFAIRQRGRTVGITSVMFDLNIRQARRCRATRYRDTEERQTLCSLLAASATEPLIDG